MDLTEIRQEIDKIDQELVTLFCARMQLSAQVADYKKANQLPIYVPDREQAILSALADASGPEMAEYVQRLYTLVFELSRNYQYRRNSEEAL